MILTDEDGKKWEVVNNFKNIGVKVIKPLAEAVETKREWEVVNRLSLNDDSKYFDKAIVVNHNFGDVPATAIREAVEAVMEHIMDSGKVVDWRKIERPIDKARKALEDK